MGVTKILKIASKQPQKKSRGGRPRIELTEKEKLMAIKYVTAAGFWKVRLADFLKISFPTLENILKKDASFFNDLKAAEAVFIGKIIQKAKPEFILRAKAGEEFPDSTQLDNESEQASEEIRKVVLRVREILPESGQ